MPDDNDQAAEHQDMVGTIVASLNSIIVSLREEIRVLSDNEKTSRKRTYAVLALVAFFVLLAVGQARWNYNQGRDVKRLVQFIEGCQNPDSACAKRNADQLGRAVKAVGSLVFDSTTCVLAQPLEERTRESIAACRDRYFPQ